MDIQELLNKLKSYSTYFAEDNKIVVDGFFSHKSDCLAFIKTTAKIVFDQTGKSPTFHFRCKDNKGRINKLMYQYKRVTYIALDIQGSQRPLRTSLVFVKFQCKKNSIVIITIQFLIFKGKLFLK